MLLRWLGHACFLLTRDDGSTLCIDPFHEKVGYATPRLKADVVICSHSHYDHACLDHMNGGFVLVNTAGYYNVAGFAITMIPSFHDDKGGAEKGSNLISVIRAEGQSICHCGDLGHLLLPEQLRQIGAVDVLALPVGGGYTIDAAQARQVYEQINPAVVVPMHYMTAACRIPLEGLEPFLALCAGLEKRYPGNSFSLEQSGGPAVFIMSYQADA